MATRVSIRDLQVVLINIVIIIVIITAANLVAVILLMDNLSGPLISSNAGTV